MLLTYRVLEQIAKTEFSDIVKNTTLIGNDYSFHWEQRAVRGLIHRWDNAPDHPEVESFPHHFHEEKENNIVSSHLDDDMRGAFKEVLVFIRIKLKDTK
ncbi:MAG TPA: DUF6516 family protein [Candidatus Limnocylindrales bacterium]|nr:DUF6516 family protein [Candidatus Limnocylindrales bacterium]